MTFIPGGSANTTAAISSGSDVALSSPASGQVLTYNASLQKWQNGSSGRPQTKAVVLYIAATSSYPSRPTGFGSVEWVGPADPGQAALEFDTWLNTAAV